MRRRNNYLSLSEFDLLVSLVFSCSIKSAKQGPAACDLLIDSPKSEQQRCEPMAKVYVPRGAIRMEYGSESCFIVPSLLKHTLPSDPVLQARSALFCDRTAGRSPYFKASVCAG